MKALVFFCMLSCLILAGCPRVASVDDQGANLNPPSDTQGDNNTADGGDQGSAGGNDDQGSGSQDGVNPPPPDSGDNNPPDDNNPPANEATDIPAGTYSGQIMGTVQLDTQADRSVEQCETPHIGNLVRFDADGLPYVSDRWVPDAGGVAEEGLMTTRLIRGPGSSVYLVQMTIDQLDIESDLVRIHWSINADSPYWCDQGACVDTYEYDGNQSVTVTTAVQLKWDEGGLHTLTVNGQSTFGLQ